MLHPQTNMLHATFVTKDETNLSPPRNRACNETAKERKKNDAIYGIYPYLCRKSPINDMAGIYLHIPFCKTRCAYCDFYSTTLPEWKERYVQALCKELEIREGYLAGEKIETIYFGGGTPSQLNRNEWKKIFDTLSRLYPIGCCKEITVEANPDDLSPEYAEMLATFPFNRISIGIQTFHEPLLKLLKRRHTATQAIEAVRNCRKAGFTNVSIDLMYGLPDETKAIWENDLEQALELQPEHISAYHLTYEGGTELWKMKRDRRINETSEENSLEFYNMLTERLKASGYIHYEISNFCLPGRFSRHNSSYWKGIPYLGCGPSAHSYDGMSHRQWNTASLTAYIKGIENGTPDEEKEYLDQHTRYNEFVITSLRTMWGMPLEKLKETYGEKLHDYCMECARPYIKNGELTIADSTLHISPKGVFISDRIMSDLLAVD